MNSVMVSVIIPTYNRARHVTEAVDSVLAQTYGRVEIIVVDDGSTDNTGHVLAVYGDRITVLRQSNRGPGAARNQGIRRARGEYVAFLDSDDLWTPDRLERQVKAAKARGHGPVLWFADADEIAADGKCLGSEWRGRRHFEPEVPAGEAGVCEHPVELLARIGDYINTSTMLVKREALLAVGLYNEALRVREDLDLAVRLGRVGPFGYVNSSLALRRRVHQKGDPTADAYGANARVFGSLSREPSLSKEARASAWAECADAARRAQGLLFRQGLRVAARRQIRAVPGWWCNVGFLARYFALYVRPRTSSHRAEVLAQHGEKD